MLYLKMVLVNIYASIYKKTKLRDAKTNERPCNCLRYTHNIIVGIVRTPKIIVGSKLNRTIQTELSISDRIF